TELALRFGPLFPAGYVKVNWGHISTFDISPIDSVGRIQGKGRSCAREADRLYEREVAREVRIQRSGAWYHLTARGNKPQPEKWEQQQFRDRYGDSGRDLVLCLGRKRGGVGLRELGELAGGFDYTSVRLAVKRFEKRRSRLKRLKEMADRAEKAFE